MLLKNYFYCKIYLQRRNVFAVEQKHLHYGHRERLRKQVSENGLEPMHEHQVLEYLLTFVIPQKDTNGIAHLLIEEFGGLAGVMEADVNALKRVKGVGDVVAHFLAEFRDFYYYYQKRRSQSIKVIKDLSTAKQYVLPLLTNLKKEEVYLIGIDGNNRIISTKQVATGSSNQANINTRLVMDSIVSQGLSNFIVAHNYPYGMAIPSPEDNKFTKAVTFGVAITNVHFLDHLIVGTDGVYSYYHSGLLADYKEEAKKVLNISVGLAQNSAVYGDGNE